MDQVKVRGSKKAKVKAAAVEGGRKVGELNPPPAFIAERQAMWDRLKAASDEFLAAQVPEPIQVKYPKAASCVSSTK